MYEDVSLDDLKIILESSIIQWKGEPIYVSNVSRGKLEARASDNKQLSIELKDPALDFSPVPLGMCNRDGRAFFITRKTGRQWCQGLTSENFKAYSLLTNSFVSTSILMGDLKCMFATVKGEYPSLEEATNLLEKKETEVVAFSRMFAVDKEFKLYYRTENVGVLNDDLSPVFLRNRGYLKEVFYE